MPRADPSLQGASQIETLAPRTHFPSQPEAMRPAEASESERYQLGIHHVHPGDNQLAWDLGFLASGVLLLTLGGSLVSSVSPAAATE